MSNRVVRARVNASGQRLIGLIDLPRDESRVSDLLNDSDEFLIVRADGSASANDPLQLIRKDALSYIQTLDEPPNPPRLQSAGAFTKVTIILRCPENIMTGRVFVPERADIVRSINDARRFLNVTDVHFENSPESYEYLAIAKRQVLLLRT